MPARLLLDAPPAEGVCLRVPHLYGYKGPKWLRGIEYMTQDRRGFWEERGLRTLADPWAGRRYSYRCSYQEDEEQPGDEQTPTQPTNRMGLHMRVI